MLANITWAQKGCETRKLTEKEESDFKKAMGMSKSFKSSKTQNKAAGTYVIPVVFHILHNGAGSVSKSDMQCRIDDVLKTVNGDFNGTFPGFNTTDPRFNAIKDKMDIQFVAATVDPDGNVMSTPGMDWQADANIAFGYDPKIYNYMWWGKKNKFYLDVVVVDAPNKENETNGSGHAFLPVQDVIPHVTYNWRYVGSTCGSISAPGFEKIMTHEFGHYFGLKHTFDGDCGTENDGIDDTPPTTQAEGCVRNKLNNCGVYANLENHMDYNTSCQNMFTKNQVTVMTFWLDDTSVAKYPRAQLWQDSNLSSVGIINRAPIADFSSDYSTVCKGKSITFEDLSLGQPTSWQWQFEGGSPTTSTSKNPVVQYSQAGIYKVRLQANNATGQNIKEKLSYIYIDQKTAAPTSENFQGTFPSAQWDVINPDNGLSWEKRNDAGNGDTSCIIMNNADNATIGEEDFLRLPYYDFSSAKNSEISFDVAYTKFDDASPDVLKVQVSTNCGTSWTDVYSKTHTELETKSITKGLSNGWVPKQESDWRKEVVDLSNYEGQSQVAIRFKNISGYGTRIWLDNINVILTNNNPPVSEFYADKRVSSCNTTEISFQDVSSGKPTSWNWTFEGGTPATSTVKNPKITYNTPGSYAVTLSTTNTNGSSTTVTKNGYITITSPTKNSLTEGFGGSFPPTGWEIIDNDGDLAWEKRNDVGNGDSSCMIMNNSDNKTVGEIDEIILNPLDLSTSGASFQFDVAYTKFDIDSKDQLKVFASTNCGSTWVEVYSKTHTELETFSAVDNPDTWINEINDWRPSTSSHWRTEQIALNQFTGKSNVLIKFHNISGYGTRIWIDNVKFTFDTVAGLTPPTGLTASNVTQTGVTLSWNAAPSGEGVTGYDVYNGNTLTTSVTGTTTSINGLTANTAYQFRVKSKNASGTTSDFSTAVNITTSGTVATLTPPTGLTASNITATGVTLSWDAAPSGEGVTGYDIYNGDTLETSVTGTTATISGLTENTAYQFRVKSKNTAGTTSDFSTTANVITTGIIISYCEDKSSRTSGEFISNVILGTINNTTNRSTNGYGDHTSLSTNLAKGSSNTITITPNWGGGTTYNEGYGVWIDYNQDGDFADTGERVFTKTPSKDTPVTGSFNVPANAKTGSTRMRIIMEYFNNTTSLPEICKTNHNYGETEDYTVNITGGQTTDTQAPSVPSNVTVSNVTQTTLSLNWTASTDNVAVTGYDVYRGTTKLTTVTTTSYSVTGLTANTAYTFSVKAKDAAGNESASSNNVNVTTSQAIDTQAPSAPGNLTASNVAQTTVSLNWTASTDNVAVTGYDVYSGTTKLTTVTSSSYNVTGLTANTAYPFSVKAKDAANNESASSNSVTITTTGVIVPTPTYCSATGNAGPEGVINVNFAGINNSSVRNSTGYDDFTSIPANVSTGTSHNLKVTIAGYQGGGSDKIYAWFDWNQNGDFTDSGEFLELTKTTNLIGEVSVSVPQTAKIGATRMRLLVSYYTAEKNPCDTGTNDVRYGEYEDYTINVSASNKSLELGQAGQSITASPNPVSNGILNLNIDTIESGMATIQFYNTNGIKVAEYDELIGGQQIKTLQLGDQLKAGMYLIRVQSGSFEATTRVIVE